jgi:hypothetical protein
MNISENEVSSVEDGGMLDGHEVKFVKTIGGFWVATGKPKGQSKVTALAAGSHPAVVRYDLKKRHPTFQPLLAKSEGADDSSVVDKHSHFLTQELRKSGHDIYSIQDGPEIAFHITKHNMKIAEVSSFIQDNFLVINGLNIPKEFARGMAGAVTEKSTESNLGLRFKK